MAKISTLIIEDNYSLSLEIEMLLGELGHDIVGTAKNIHEARQFLAEKFVDIIISDIKLESGDSAIELFQDIDLGDTALIYITSSKDAKTYDEAMATSPSAFLVKPFDLLTLRNAVENALKIDTISYAESSFGVGRHAIFIKQRGMLIKVVWNSILWMNSEGNYCFIHTHDRKFIVRAPLKLLFEKIQHTAFIQTHKSYVVNLDQIEEVNLSQNLVLTTKGEIPIGRKYKQELLKRMNKI